MRMRRMFIGVAVVAAFAAGCTAPRLNQPAPPPGISPSASIILNQVELETVAKAKELASRLTQKCGPGDLPDHGDVRESLLPDVQKQVLHEAGWYYVFIQHEQLENGDWLQKEKWQYQGNACLRLTTGSESSKLEGPYGPTALDSIAVDLTVLPRVPKSLNCQKPVSAVVTVADMLSILDWSFYAVTAETGQATQNNDRSNAYAVVYDLNAAPLIDHTSVRVVCAATK